MYRYWAEKYKARESVYFVLYVFVFVFFVFCILYFLSLGYTGAPRRAASVRARGVEP